jgi:hypothetical protein
MKQKRQRYNKMIISHPGDCAGSSSSQQPPSLLILNKLDDIGGIGTNAPRCERLETKRKKLHKFIFNVRRREFGKINEFAFQYHMTHAH